MLDLVPILAAEESGGGSFLVKPGVGLMIWTLVAFGITLWVLSKLAFPRIAEALDKRQRAIEESIDSAEKTKREADALLSEYRERLGEARHQAEEIVARARKAAEATQKESLEQARVQREELMEQKRRDIQSEDRKSVVEGKSVDLG